MGKERGGEVEREGRKGDGREEVVHVTEMTQHGASGAELHNRAANRPRH